MKKLKVTNPAACQFCLECVNTCSMAYYKEAGEDMSCIRMAQKKNGTWAPAVCPQCGKCASVCESGAITQNPKTGVYMINKKKCTQCGKCAEVCPFHVLVKMPDKPASKCTACGLCVKACPMGILEIVEK